MSDNQRRRILILGGGFGGMYAALHLERTLAHARGVDITIVNRDNFSGFVAWFLWRTIYLSKLRASRRRCTWHSIGRSI